MRMLVSPRTRGFLVAATMALLGLAGCDIQDPVSRGSMTAFDSKVEVSLIGVNRERAAKIIRVLESDMAFMESAWHAWEPSPVSRMNLLFNVGEEAFAAPPSVLPLLELSKELARDSEQLFNPAIGHLERAWGFQGRPAECLRPPPQDIIDTVIAKPPSLDEVTIDGFRVWSSNALVKLDFRGIQKGFALDRLAARLKEFGVHNASISIDGNTLTLGSRDGNPWSVGIRGPGGGIVGTVKLSGNEAVFTNDESRGSFTWDGKIYHDTIDPRTGYPATGTASVTVLHPNASTADAAATALFVAGPEDWHRIARKMGIHYVMLTDHAGRIHMNPAMQSRVKLQRSNEKIIISEPLS